MLIHKFLIVLCLLAIVAGCSGVTISQDYDVATNFSTLKTFDWQSALQEKTGDVRIDNPLLNDRIRTAITRTLTEKGYNMLTRGAPDFLVRYQYTIQRRITAESVYPSVRFGFGTFGRHGGVGVSTGTGIGEYDEGSLVIDFYHAINKGLLWRGIGTFLTAQHSDPKKTTTQVNETVDKILSQFPPLQKK